MPIQKTCISAHLSRTQGFMFFCWYPCFLLINGKTVFGVKLDQFDVHVVRCTAPEHIAGEVCGCFYLQRREAACERQQMSGGESSLNYSKKCVRKQKLDLTNKTHFLKKKSKKQGKKNRNEKKRSKKIIVWRSLMK